MNGIIKEVEPYTLELDLLLWEVLWQPLGLPREIRQTFPLEGPMRGFGYYLEGRLLAGAVISGERSATVDFHHLAVRPEAQGMGLGAALVEAVVNALSPEAEKLVAWARRQNQEFFRKQGFRVLEAETFSPDLFKKAGVSLVKVELDLT